MALRTSILGDTPLREGWTNVYLRSGSGVIFYDTLETKREYADRYMRRASFGKRIAVIHVIPKPRLYA